MNTRTSHRPRRRIWFLAPIAIGLVAGSAAALEAARPNRIEDGIALAMAGETARAERFFASTLTHTRGDARAFNDIGNLRMLANEPGAALAFYDRALLGDTADAGIHLNRMTALRLLGDEARAEEAAARAIRLAGGSERALSLLGLGPPRGESGKAVRRTFLSQSEIRRLIRRALDAVPNDTTSVRHSNDHGRQGGSRADDMNAAAMTLYWKR